MVVPSHKGGAFELLICKRLSLWVSGGQRKDLYQRSAMSGGQATLGSRRGEDWAHQAGDITSTHPEGYRLLAQFYVECKHYKDLELRQFLLGKGLMAGIWKDTCEKAQKHGKTAMVIARQNSQPILAMTAPRYGLVEGTTILVGGFPSMFMCKFDDLLGVDPGRVLR